MEIETSKRIKTSDHRDKDHASIKSIVLSKSASLDVLLTLTLLDVKARKQKYRNQWEDVDIFRGWLSRSSNNKAKAFCRYCRLELEPHKKGLESHAKRKKHLEKAELYDQTLIVDCTNVVKYTKRAEILWSLFISKNDLPFLLSDTACDFFKNMFPDSVIARNLKCRRTTTTNIAKRVLAPAFSQGLTRVLDQQPFSLLFDSSTDVSGKNVCLAEVRYFCYKEKEMKTFIYKAFSLPKGEAQTIFKALDDMLQANKINPKYMIAFAPDRENSMIGDEESVYQKLKTRI